MSNFREDLKFHRRDTKNLTGDNDNKFTDTESDGGLENSSWAFLMDKGYRGDRDGASAIIPKKKPVSRSLNSIEKKINERTGSDRAIVETHFGLMTGLWTIMMHCKRCCENIYDPVPSFLLCDDKPSHFKESHEGN